VASGPAVRMGRNLILQKTYQVQMDNVIELNKISFSYADIKAIDDISIKVDNGTFGLLGPNGAGKTTLLKIILGFLTPHSGIGRVLGFDITSSRKAVRKQIGYMPESECLIPGMDAVTFVSYLGELSGMPKQEAIKRAHEVLYYVGLEESRYRDVETYSSGMQQRLKLAQALVHDPKLLLLDEPTSGMDPSGRKEMLNLIKDISEKKQMNLIISSHLLPDIEYTCENVIILNEGKVISEEVVANVSKSNFNLFELKFKGDDDRFLERLQEIGCQIQGKVRDKYMVLLPAKKSSGILFKIAVEESIQIRHFKPSRTTLEDTFIKAVGVARGH
jgi:ABC-2 type transport system ATP-binding protein